MGKSKKTLALVMALVMAFTIVPFGAWYGFKAAAEEPTTQANTYYQPITEIKHGQNYIIAVKDDNGQMRVLTTTQTSVDYNPAKDIWGNHITNAEPFDVNQPLNENVEKRATWQYNILERGKGGFIQNIDGKKISLDFGNDTSKDGDAPYVYSWPGDPISTPQRQISFKKAGKAENEFQMYDNQAGEAKGNLYYTANDPRFHVGLVRSDGGPDCHVFLYEKVTDLPETIEFPIEIRDLHGDHILVDHDAENNEIFNLSTAASKDEHVNGEGYVFTKFLNLAGERDSAGYRKGLTQENLNNDGELQYSPYTVIYVANALRETLWGENRGTSGVLFNDSPLGTALTKKFMNYYREALGGGTSGSYYYKESVDANGKELEEYLYSYSNNNHSNGSIVNLYNLLTTGGKKGVADQFFKEYLTATDDNARNFLIANGIDGNNMEILMDYKKTVNHASELNYERIVNENPSFDQLNGKIAVDNNSWLADGYKWENKTYPAYGASLMDVAWYLLHHFFVDSDAATSLTGTARGEEEFQYYSKKVADSPVQIQLKRVMKQDGSVSYVYDSSFDSDWGNATTPLTNVTLDQNSYKNDRPTASTAYFCPIDNKGFKNSANLDGSGNHGHNYGFSLKGSGKFVYNDSEKLFFEFNGDDDVFLYINNKRVDSVDLGGTHSPITGRIGLEDQKPGTNMTWAQYLGLSNGNIFDFDFFYMERNPVGSNFKMETNIRVMREDLLPQKNAYSQVDCNNSKRIPYDGVVGLGDTIYYEFVATNGLPNKQAGETGTYVSNLVFQDDDLNVKISATESKNISDTDAANMTYYIETYNETTGKWVTKADANGVHFKNKADLQEKVGSWVLKPGERVFICGIPHTVDKTNLEGKYFSNNLYVSGVSGNVNEIKPILAQTRVKVVDIQDKTFVVDFAGNLRVRAEQLFSESELANDVTLVSATGGTYGTPSVDKTANTLEYTMTSALNAADEVQITEKFPGVSFVDDTDTTGKEYEYIYSATKNIKLVPANNVYYDDSFEGITYSDNWHSTNGAGGVITGISGTNEIYGNTTDDTAFTGDSHFITGDGTDKSVTASFDFKGDGVSVYMDTSASSGRIVSTIQKYKDADRTEKDGGAILDMYDVESSASYNGVPVINRTELKGYGYYRVEIKAYIPEGTTASLTGIRVYNPMNNNEDLGIYEQNAKFIEIRDNLKNASELTAVDINGALYIDNIDGQGTVVDNIDGYLTKGPKNEIYLGAGQAIAFKVVNTTPDSKVHVSARSLTGAPAQMNYNKDINSSLDMYYDITTTDHLYVIRNTGDSVLSLTNLKITNAKDDTRMVVSNEIAAQALAMFNAPVEPEVPEEPETPSKPQSPIQKFFEDVRNFFNKLFGKH